MIRIISYSKPKENQKGTAIQTGGGGFSNITYTNVNQSLVGHTLWGQFFDGTQDVTGDMTGVGSITATGDVKTDGDVHAHNFYGDFAQFLSAYTSHLSATTVTGDTLNYNQGNFKDITAKTADIEAISSNDITTNNLTVTGLAHFFQLMIDKVKATQGSIIVTPANARIEYVRKDGDNYYCYWRATDGYNCSANMFEVGDQVICETFSKAVEGTLNNVSNKYYWTLVDETGHTVTDTSTWGDGWDNNTLVNYIRISSKICDGEVLPEAGDDIVQLGHRKQSSETYEESKMRQDAIIISAYKSPDKNVTSPSIAQYTGIDTFSFPKPINLLSGGENYFKGKFTTEGGDDLEEMINDKINNQVSYFLTSSSHFYQDADKDITFVAWKQIGANEPQKATDGYVTIVHGDDASQTGELKVTSSKAKTGENGYDVKLVLSTDHNVQFDTLHIDYIPQPDYVETDVEELVPLVESAVIDVNDNLIFTFNYGIREICGNTVTMLSNDKLKGLTLQISTDTQNKTLTVNGQSQGFTGSYSDDPYSWTAITKCHDLIPNIPKTIRVEYHKGTDIPSTRSVPVVYDAGAIMTVDDDIRTRVQGIAGSVSTLIDDGEKYKRQIEDISGNVSTISATSQNITAMVGNTGYNIEDGTFTINGDKTIINGNLSINGNDNAGLTLYDKDGNPRVKISPDDLPDISDMRLSQNIYTRSQQGAGQFTVSSAGLAQGESPRVKIGDYEVNDKLNIDGWFYMTLYDAQADGWDQLSSSKDVNLTMRIYASETATTPTFTYSTTARVGRAIERQTYQIATKGTYYASLYYTVSVNTKYTKGAFYAMFMANRTTPSITVIGNDGLAMQQGTYRHLYINEDKVSFCWGGHDGFYTVDKRQRTNHAYRITSDGELQKALGYDSAAHDTDELQFTWGAVDGCIENYRRIDSTSTDVRYPNSLNHNDGQNFAYLYLTADDNYVSLNTNKIGSNTYNTIKVYLEDCHAHGKCYTIINKSGSSVTLIDNTSETSTTDKRNCIWHNGSISQTVTMSHVMKIVYDGVELHWNVIFES